MPWLCGRSSSRKKSKTKIGTVSVSKDDSILSTTKPKFAVVLQNFESSAADELTVQRGQVVEHLYTDKGWTYIRDVDGLCGYIPDNFCYALELMAGSQWNTKVGVKSPKIRPRPRTLNMDELSLSGSQTFEIRFETHPSDTTPTPSRAEAKEGDGEGVADSKDDKPAESSGTSAEVVRKDSAAASCNQDPTASPGKVESTDGSNDVGAGSRLAPAEAESQPQPVPRPGRAQRIRRANSYREAVSSSEKAFGMRAETTTSKLPAAATPTLTPTVATTTGTVVGPAEASQSVQADDKSHEQSEQTEPVVPYDRLDSALSHMTDVSMPDDVFLPDTKKPQGIYQCVEGYEARFRGELSLQRNELVVVLEFGRGEWAWVFTSSNVEGLVPKSSLVRYQPGRLKVGGATDSAPQSNATTQTELVVSNSLKRIGCSMDGIATASASEGGVGTPDAPADGRLKRRDKRRSHLLHLEKEFVSIGVQTEWLTPNWYRDSDSEKSSHGRTPVTSPEHRPPDAARSAPASNPMRPKHLPMRTPTPTRAKTPSRLATASPLAPAQQRSLQQKRLVKSFESDRGYDSPGSAANSGRQPRFQHTPCLTAVSEYTPPLNAKNCLCLLKGDLLYQQPTSSRASNGWMWVYHSGQRSFGFVPLSHVAYMYTVERKSRPGGIGTLLEDEV